ncbi:hypothetical protein BT69DRAFT_1258702 [Atractiella rhizophila]|nr:hypothetical protein BT69DRAFT_1258702 [Atractiella rhizophila]
MISFLTILLSISLIPFSQAHDHGGSMSDGSTMSVNALMGQFHTGIGGDQLWFAGWIPTSAGTTFASAFGLALLAVFSRLLSAVRTQLDHQWAVKGRVMRLQAIEASSGRASAVGLIDGAATQRKSAGSASVDSTTSDSREKTRAPSRLTPFIAAHDIPRGLLQILQSGIGYLLMLAVMMGNVWWFIAVLLGLGIGETLFGRFAHVEDHH